MFSFEMVHFDAFWSTFRPTIIATAMFMTSAEVKKITVCPMRTISTLKPAKIACININYWSFRIKVDPDIFV